MRPPLASTSSRSTPHPAACAGASIPAPATADYRFAGYDRLTDPDGYPGSKPPWGTLTAIDLASGRQRWQVPLGEFPELAAAGVPTTGTENYGGPVVTAGGIVFIGATAYDSTFRAFDADTGALLWKAAIPAGGHATPAVYAVAGREYVVIAAGGGKGRGASAATYVAFALPRGAERGTASLRAAPVSP